MSKDEQFEVSHEDLQGVAQWVFTNTLADMKNRIEDEALAGDRYQMLGLAPILRKLLIDGGNLVQLVNRRYRIPLTFKIVPFEMSDRAIHEKIASGMPRSSSPVGESSYWRLFAPGSLMPSAESPGVELGLAHFLAAHVGIVRGRRISVKELIQFYCIVEGGVHIGMPRRDYEKDMLVMVPTELSLHNQGIDNSPISSLYVCAEIVLASLQPLLEMVEKDPVDLKPKQDVFVYTEGVPRHRRGKAVGR